MIGRLLLYFYGVFVESSSLNQHQPFEQIKLFKAVYNSNSGSAVLNGYCVFPIMKWSQLRRRSPSSSSGNHQHLPGYSTHMT